MNVSHTELVIAAEAAKVGHPLHASLFPPLAVTAEHPLRSIAMEYPVLVLVADGNPELGVVRHRNVGRQEVGEIEFVGLMEVSLDRRPDHFLDEVFDLLNPVSLGTRLELYPTIIAGDQD